MGVLELTISGTVLILVIAAIRGLLGKRLPRRMFCVLWAVALARLLIPVSLPAPSSIYNASALSAPHPALSNLPQTILPAGAQEAAAGSVAAGVPAPLESGVSTVLWLLGALILGGYFLWCHLRCRRTYAQSLPAADEAARQWLAEHPLRRRVELRRSDRVAAPLTYGLLRPVILLPATLEPSALPYVLAHEWTHIRRLDVVYKWALCAVLCIHWFNPAVWLLYVMAGRDLELSCDEAVIQSCGVQSRSGYALALLGLEEARGGLEPLCNHFSKTALETRIRSIMKYRRASMAAVLASVALVGTVTACFATSASKSYAEKHYGPLMQFRFQGYEELSVGEYRRQVQEKVGKTIGEDEFLLLIDTILRDNAINRSALMDPDSWFLLNTLRLSVMDGWQEWSVDGNGYRNYGVGEKQYTLELGLSVDYELLDPEGITVGERDAAFRGMIEGAWAFLESKSPEELKRSEQLLPELGEELERLEERWETPALDLDTRYGYSYTDGADAAEMERVRRLEEREMQEARGTPGSRADYDRLLALMGDGWRNESLKDFSNRLFRAADDSGFQSASERVRGDFLWDDVQVTLTDEERSFLSHTLENSWAENQAQNETAFSGETVDARYDVDWWPIRTESQPYYDREITTFSASAAFYFYRHIPDPSKVTVGERDDRVLAVAEEIKSWLLEQSNEQLTAKDRDQRFQAAFDRICREHSDGKITFYADAFWVDAQSEDWSQEQLDALDRLAAGQAILTHFGLDPQVLYAIDGSLPDILEGQDLDDALVRFLEETSLFYFMSKDSDILYGVRQEEGTEYLYTFRKDPSGTWFREEMVRTLSKAS
ncbi:M56 family metallopeptidase [Oscillibacter hominis]|uniref:M56 family metallopeptidase n=1 Tax=Oscillibacter hominis TaxID=2763056 RepID=A0A7G9B7H2_9FIRM|nr:M56 family metallopeptidase [Oscillibacter hominis]QNL45503.1 M56 family metallopeptidase [Oscillibacter hominis]